jgi:hypothetical protein
VGHPTRSALTFEVAVGAVAVHAGRLVAIEQRTGAGEVEVRDLVTGKRSTVEVGVAARQGCKRCVRPARKTTANVVDPSTTIGPSPENARASFKTCLTGEGEIEPTHRSRGQSSWAFPVGRFTPGSADIARLRARVRYLTSAVDGAVAPFSSTPSANGFCD